LPEESDTEPHQDSPVSPDIGKNRWFNPVFFLFLGAITLIAYWPVLDNTLLCDDYYLLGMDRLHLFGGGGLGDLSSLRWIFYAEYPVQLRPVILSVWLLISHFYGVEAWPTHLLNVVLHAANAWMIFWLLTRLKASRITAVLPALLFALTPIGPEAVTWSSGNVDLFPLFFLLLGFGAYSLFLENGRKLWYAASLAAMAMALLSKEMAMIMVVLIPAMELLYGDVFRSRNNMGDTGSGRTLRQAAIRVSPFLLLFAGYLALRLAILGTLAQGSQLPSITGGFEYSPLFTISVLLAPFSNMYFHTYFIAAVSLYTLLLLVSSLVLVATGWSKAGKQTTRLWIFLVLAFAVSLVPVSSYLVSGLNLDLARSHFLYISTAFFLSLVSVGLLEFGWRGKKWSGVGAAAILLLLPLYFWGLQENNRYWEDAAVVESVILDEMASILPEPPANSRIYLVLEEETQAARIYWCKPMLQIAVRSKYDRYDIKVVQEGSSDRIEDVGDDTSDGYLFIYDESTNQLRLDHPPST
jgi:hypothetical protein